MTGLSPLGSFSSFFDMTKPVREQKIIKIDGWMDRYCIRSNRNESIFVRYVVVVIEIAAIISYHITS